MKRMTKIDKSGRPFEIGASCPGDIGCLQDMYRTFDPRPGSQGLPPEGNDACQEWVKKLFDIGENLLAWRGSRVVGHVALVPDVNGTSVEFVIFVDQEQRNLGIGTELTQVALERCRQVGIDSVWLSVNVSNSVAIRLYKKVGFEYCDWDICERMMRAKL